MTQNNEREEFEKWLKKNYPDYPPPLSEVWQAATKASESEINSLKERVAELQASNNQLREALEICKYDCHTGEVIGIAEKALKATPTQSLAERKEEYECKLMSQCTDPNL